MDSQRSNKRPYPDDGSSEPSNPEPKIQHMSFENCPLLDPEASFENNLENVTAAFVADPGIIAHLGDGEANADLFANALDGESKIGRIAETSSHTPQLHNFLDRSQSSDGSNEDDVTAGTSHGARLIRSASSDKLIQDLVNVI